MPRVAHVLELLRSADTLDGFLDQPAAIAPEDVVAGSGASVLDLRPGTHVGKYE